MMRFSIFVSLLAAATVGLSPWAALAADWGNLKGRFIYDGTPPKAEPIDTGKEPQSAQHMVVSEEIVVNPKDHGLANVVVFVNSKKVKEHPDYKKTAADKVTIDNMHCRFEPHIVALRVSQTLVIKNSDPFSHNSNLAPIGDSSINPLLTEGASTTFKFNKAQRLPVPVACNIHTWMKGYVVVKDNPYVAVSDESGNFELKNLPAEELEFAVWHEAKGWLPAKKEWDQKKATFKKKIKAGDDDLGEIKVSSELFKKK